MAFSVASLAGMPIKRSIAEREIFWLPGDPGVTFTKGNRYALSGGVLIAATDSLAAPFVAARTVTMAASTTAFTKPRNVHPANADEETLVPCTVDIAAGTQVRHGKMNGYADETVVSYTASTRAIACTTGFGADDYPNGAFVYVYDGPGAGEFNIVEDYDHADGAAALLLICHRAFSATLTSSSKFIVTGSAAGANAVGPFSRMDIYDTDELDVTDGIDDGNITACVSWDQLADTVANGHMPHIPTSAIFDE